MSIFHLASLLSERRVREMYRRECVLILSVAVVIIIVRTSRAPKDWVIGRWARCTKLIDFENWDRLHDRFCFFSSHDFLVLQGTDRNDHWRQSNMGKPFDFWIYALKTLLDFTSHISRSIKNVNVYKLTQTFQFGSSSSFGAPGGNRYLSMCAFGN